MADFATFPLDPDAHIRWPVGNTDYAFGLDSGPGNVRLLLIKELSGGGWNIVRSQSNAAHNGMFWHFIYSGAFGDMNANVDPDGVLDPLEKKMIKFVALVNERGANNMVTSYINEVNDLIDEEEGRLPPVPESPTPDNFSSPATALDAIKATFGNIVIENERLVLKN